MIDEQLVQYGMAGIFIAYLIYDRQILLGKIMKSLERNTEAINLLISKIKSC